MNLEKRQTLLSLKDSYQLERFINQHKWSKEERETVRKAWRLVQEQEGDRIMGMVQESRLGEEW